MNTNPTQIKPKKPFYKLKRFYIPIFIFFALIILCIALLYKPIKLISLGTIEYEKKEKEIFLLTQEATKRPDLFLQSYVVDENEFDEILNYLETSRRDFIIAHFFGFGEEYIGKFHIINTINMYLISLRDIAICLDKQRQIKDIKGIKIKQIAYIEDFFTYLKQRQYFNNVVYEWSINGVRFFFYGTLALNLQLQKKDKEIYIFNEC